MVSKREGGREVFLSSFLSIKVDACHLGCIHGLVDCCMSQGGREGGFFSSFLSIYIE